MSLTSESHVKIVNRKSMFGAQLRINKSDKTYQNWHFTIGPLWETKYYWISCMNKYQIRELFSFDLEKIKPQKQHLVPEITFKPKIGIWRGRITYRYYMPLEKNNNFLINDIEFRKKVSFLGKGYTGWRIILRTIPERPKDYSVNFQINSERRYLGFIDYTRFSIGYSFRIQNNKSLPGKFYISARMLI